MPNFNDGEKLLVALARAKATELRLAPHTRLLFWISGDWREAGNRDLAVEDIRGITVDLLGEDLANVVRSGKDLQVRCEISGYGGFLVRASDRDGHAFLSVIPVASPRG